jgi:cell division protein ZapA
MSEAPNLVHVEIFGQTYAIRAGTDPKYVEQLASYVDGQMRDVARASGVVDTMRIAVLTALNIADEYFQAKSGGQAGETELRERAAQLAKTLGRVLDGGD